MGEEKGNSSLFAVFVLSLLTLALIPWTIYKTCGSGGTEQVAQPWLGKKKQSLVNRLQKACTSSNLVLLSLWAVWGLLVVYTQYMGTDVTPFDPFAILQLSPGADSSDIKKAYRKLSLVYHPDKNPDPKATEYFAEYITKAYQALTDETARANYEKYGHPDGQQAQDVGIALPEWIFSKDRKTAPLVLGGLVGIGILLPLAFASCYLLRSNRFAGPNNLMQETIEIFFSPKLGIKEQQSLAKIPDTLVCAMEFITLPTSATQEAAFATLRSATLRLHPELKDKATFWKRRTSVVKVHMLLLAHLAREPIPEALQKDLQFVLGKCPILLEELFKVAQVPRTQAGTGWLEPGKSSIELSQCITRAVPVSARRSSVGKATSDPLSPMLQLPHVDAGLLKKLSRSGVKQLSDLMGMDSIARLQALQSAGLTTSQIDDVDTTLMAVPAVRVKARCLVEGEDPGAEILEQDFVTLNVWTVLTRLAHMSSGPPPSTAAQVQTFAVDFPGVKHEKWYFLLCDPASNAVWASQLVTLAEAEAAGAELWQQQGQGKARNGARATANGAAEPSRDQKPILEKNSDVLALWEGTDAEGSDSSLKGKAGRKGKGQRSAGQLVQLRFKAPKPGKYSLQLYVMSDCWIGSDLAVPVTFKTSEMNLATVRQQTRKPGAAAGEEIAENEPEDKPEDGSDVEEEEEQEEYDSEETGTDESGSDTEEQ